MARSDARSKESASHDRLQRASAVARGDARQTLPNIDKTADGYEARLAKLRAELAMLDRRRPTLLSWIQLYEGFVEGAPQAHAAAAHTPPLR